MPTIYRYQKYIDSQITRELNFPVDAAGQRLGTELATVSGVTYVTIPTGATLPSNQPIEVAASVQAVVLDAATKDLIFKASPHAKFMERLIDDHLAAEAKAKGYDSIVSACSYAGAANPFQTESQSFVAWRGAVWAKCYAVLDAVLTGTRNMPTPAEMIAEMPVLV